MTNILDGLLGRIDDPALRDALAAEVGKLRDTKDFGLVFERHLPENVRLYSHPVRRGCRVQDRSDDDETTWLVRKVTGDDATLVDSQGEKTTRPVADLVVVRQFGEPIHPGFKRVGSVERGGDKPFHTVINGENYHALETLLYAYEGKVDCIYIDPPYNTGAKDWKYNNDYVDGNDGYRHSKWLSFIEKRLLLAKRLLNLNDSVLIVTIDEKEYLRLGLLLEQVFPGVPMQMVTSVINPRAGVARPEAFTRVDEYLFFVRFGAAVVEPGLLAGEAQPDRNTAPIWFSLMRTGSNSSRRSRPNLFYPVWVNPDGSLHSIGDSLALEDDRQLVSPPKKGVVPVWPLRPNGAENTWQLGPPALRKAFSDGAARIRDSRDRFTISYLRNAEKRRLADGDIELVGREASGAMILRHKEGSVRQVRPKTVWSSPGHDAGLHGSSLLKAFVPETDFTFPKSLYAVEDALRFFVQNKPDALVVDFFGGSGTTAHAVMRLNRQDGGSRRSIVVTNNEVSEEDARALSEAGHSPGDPEWEALGIFEHITKPRVAAAISGTTTAGAPVVGDYKFTDEFPMAEGFEENAEFLELTYLDRNDVARGTAFEAIAPLLWMKAGAVGEMIGAATDGYAAPEDACYAILFDIAHWQSFVDAVRGRDDLTHLFVVTDSAAQYQQVVAELPITVEAAMLYEDYLRSFEINVGGTS